MDLEEFEKGDKILFNQRKQPLEVAEVRKNELKINGPQGGKYEIYRGDEGSLLYCKEGKKRYSSYVEDLRKVGEWNRNDDTWTHSRTGAKIQLVKNNAGFWIVKSDKIDLEPVEPPKYGYSNRESAEKDVEKLIKKNPEG